MKNAIKIIHALTKCVAVEVIDRHESQSEDGKKQAS